MGHFTALIATGMVLFLTACHHSPDPGMGSAPGSVTNPAVRATFKKPVSFSILQDYKKGESLREVALDFELMKELGVTTWRGSFPWDDYEPSPGTYDFDWLQKFVALAGFYDMKLRPYLGYTAPWAGKKGKDTEYWNDPPARIEDWRTYVKTLVTALKGNDHILSYEIYNEENVPQWWDGTAAQYNKVLREASQTIRTSSPGKQVIFGGIVYPDLDWVQAACVTAGNARAFDILPFHAYPETRTPPEMVVENYLDQGTPGYFRQQFIPKTDEYCGRKPIWINETGFATTPGKTETDQANWWARAFATFLANRRVEHLGICQIKERAKTETVIGGGENYHLGITKPDRTKKLAFHTVKLLVSLLDVGTLTVADGELKTEVVDGKKIQLYKHLFVRPDGRQVLFVWDKRGSPTLRLKVRPGSTAVEYALDGRSSSYRSFDRGTLEDVKLVPGMVRIFEIRP